MVFWCSKALSSELEKTKEKAKVSKLDQLHEENVSQGRDKFKTLKQIRSGNTKSRIMNFENM